MNDWFEDEMERARKVLIGDLWRRSVGLPEIGLQGTVSYDELARTEWSTLFERLMRNRLIQGAFRYGRMGAVGKKSYDWLPSLHKRLDEYERTGNLEMLVDVANGCLLEFVESKHPFKHFASDDDGDHVKGR